MRLSTKSVRARLLIGASVAVLAMSSGVALAQDREPITIAPQSLTTALQQFGSQTSRQVMFSPGLIASKKTGGVTAVADEQLALAQLLQGTGLTFQREGDVYLIVGASDPQSGSAAGDGADGTVQALIVTAQKREEDIQDVPIAISAFTQEDLTRSQVAGGPDLVTQVPNFTFTKTNFSSYSIQIRGIGTQAISATTDPAVAVAFNNTPFIRNRFFEQEFYDLERVEVLRGPQGTLYGRNATAGVVNIISVKPKFRYEAKLSGDVGNFSSSRLEGMVNIPLVEDKVALRVAGAWTKRDGYATNELSGNPIDGRDLWSTRVSLRVAPTDRINANLIWEHFQEDDDRLRSGKQLCKKDVVSHIGDVPITNYFDTRTSGGQETALWGGVQAALSQGCKRNSLYDQSSFQRPTGLMLPYYVPLGGVGLPIALNDPYVTDFATDNYGFLDTAVVDAANDQPQDLRVIQSMIDPQYRAKSDLGELQVSVELTDTLTLSSETAYATDMVYSLQDFNRFNTAPGAWQQPEEVGGGGRPNLLMHGPNGGIFCDPQLGCSDRLMAVDVSTATASQFSQEFRLASNLDGPFNFSLGANFLRADSEDKYYVFINSLSLVAGYPLGGAALQSFPYMPGISDNIECMDNGYIQGNPNIVYPVAGCIYMDPNPIGSVNDQGHNYFLSKNPYKLISYAAFGEAYYNIAENLKVTAGLRWTVDKKEAPRIPTWILASNSVGYPVAEVIEQEWREPTGRLALDWKPDLSFTDQTLLYASYAHGYKAGGANPPGFVRVFYSDKSVAQQASDESATRPKTFDPEFVNAFELGAKNTLDDGRLTLNLASFYYDYTGYQVSEIVDRSAFNRNFDATVWGVELESDWRPLENLRLGFKGGYEKTRIADGMQAVDLMDRNNGGKPDQNGITWLVVRPFPTYASSCILPTYVFANPDGTIGAVGQVGGGGPSGCELAYEMGLDPVTGGPYVDIANGGVPVPVTSDWDRLYRHPGYPGFDPATAPNGGEGISKQLGGNELPNAPHFTATVMADYTVPLPNNWLMSLHSDVHWQSQSWWRVFNDHVYDKLHPYFTMNLAAIFTNEDAGWNIMAYVKNVTDETAITGAFLNSDDTGLTTNVFLTEPRLYGLRVTKQWTGGSWFGSFSEPHEGPFPFTVELGGQVQRHDAPNSVVAPSFASAFDARLLSVNDVQKADLDWGDGRDVKFTYRPTGSAWSVAAGLRKSQTNGGGRLEAAWYTDPVCAFLDPAACEALAQSPLNSGLAAVSRANNAQAAVFEHEEYTIADLSVGRHANFSGLSVSILSAGIRWADLSSQTEANLQGVPDWTIPNGFANLGFFTPSITHTVYKGVGTQSRDFKGLGPTVSWEASYALAKVNGGEFAVDWSATGGVLFGQQRASFADEGTSYYFAATPLQLAYPGLVDPPIPTTTTLTPHTYKRSTSATVPNVEVSLGLAYKVGRFTTGAGYHWERYFNAIDGGFEEHKSYDRTIDGPYFKVSVGFGG